MASHYQIDGVDLDDLCEPRERDTLIKWTWGAPTVDFTDAYRTNGASMKARYAQGYEQGMGPWCAYMKTITLDRYLCNGVAPVVACKGYRPCIGQNIEDMQVFDTLIYHTAAASTFKLLRTDDTHINITDNNGNVLVTKTFSYAPKMVLVFMCGGGGGGGNGGGTTSAGGAGGGGVLLFAISVPDYPDSLVFTVGGNGVIAGGKNQSGSRGGASTCLNTATLAHITADGGVGGYADNGGSGAIGGFGSALWENDDGNLIQIKEGGAGGNAYNSGGAVTVQVQYVMDMDGLVFTNTGAGGICYDRGGGGGGSIGAGGDNRWDGYTAKGPGGGGGGGGYGWFDGHWGGNGRPGCVYIAY